MNVPTFDPTRAFPRAAAILNRASLGTVCDVAVIGAGPYGLAAAAHLKAAHIEIRVFGESMAFWRRNMPQGMRLRSPWRASYIADPDREFSLDRYAMINGLARTETLPLDDFVKYGDWFQRRAVPDLDTRKVERVEAATGGFRLRLEDGDAIYARRIVIAMGLANQEFRPPEFTGIPTALASHSCEHTSFKAFRGKRVAVLGRGQSACESAVLLQEAGAEVEIISRGEIRWIGSETTCDHRKDKLLWRVHNVLTAPSAVGPFPLNWLVEAPGMVRHLPLDLRNRIGTRSLRPAASAWLRPRAGDVRTNPGRTVIRARAKGSRIALHLDNGAFSLVDHALLATGYQVDVAKYGILAPELLGKIHCIEGHPILSAGFESSVAGLHFLGSSALKSFGPLMRFVAGTGYAARSLTQATLASRS